MKITVTEAMSMHLGGDGVVEKLFRMLECHVVEEHFQNWQREYTREWGPLDGKKSAIESSCKNVKHEANTKLTYLQLNEWIFFIRAL